PDTLDESYELFLVRVIERGSGGEGLERGFGGRGPEFLEGGGHPRPGTEAVGIAFKRPLSNKHSEPAKRRHRPRHISLLEILLAGLRGCPYCAEDKQAAFDSGISSHRILSVPIGHDRARDAQVVQELDVGHEVRSPDGTNAHAILIEVDRGPAEP